MKQPIILVICKVRDLKQRIDEALQMQEGSGNQDAAWVRKHL